jgi:transposase-like protein
MNYKDIAKATGRSPTTVRKWCAKIIALSGHTFMFRINKKGQKIPKFTPRDLEKFKALAQAIDISGNFEQAVLKVYGNLQAQKEDCFTQEIKSIDKYMDEEFEKLYNNIDTLKSQIKQVETRLSKLESFNTKLKKIEVGFRKQKIGDLLK